MGRTLHLVDIENIALGTSAYGAARRAYESVVAIGADDLVVVACDVTHVFGAAEAFPGGLLRMGTGPDGADRALVGEIDVDWLAERIERLVIASGDHAFAGVARQAMAAGVRVEVAAHPGSLSWDLYRAAERWWPLEPSDVVAVPA